VRPKLEELLPTLRCPATGGPLSLRDDELVLADGSRRYPIADGVPLLIAAERSLFDIDTFERVNGERPHARLAARLRASARKLLARAASLPPTHARNVAAAANLRALAELASERGQAAGRAARVLVVGGRTVGAGMEAILDHPELDVLETDVALGPRTQLVCDAHDLPFVDASFDAVVIQAVLESVVEPRRVAQEIHRVLAAGGLVYSEAPFIQQVHEGAYDFNRFTQLGHRRLWRHFDELRSGAQCGPGMALLWSAEYFLQAFAGNRRLARGLIARLVTLGGFWLKYLDDFLARRPAGIDAASGTFFLGRRRETAIPDREIVHGFRGVPPRGQQLPRL
jgi:SAM-dependent methyltransferase